jgi:DNA-3-methyladenine glycosylase
VVTAAENNPHAVLIRAVEPLKGLNYIKENRQIKSSKIENLTNGPGKLSQALKINKNLDGCNLIESDFLYIIDTETEEFEIENSPRINIDYAEEYKDKKWRFFIKNNKYISRS